MTDQDIRTERLRAEIELKRAALAEHRAALLKLQNEIDTFARQYDRIIGPLEAQLDQIRQQIEALQSEPLNFNSFDNGSIWGPGYTSFEESFDAKYRRPNNPTITPTPRAVDETSLRSLYRKLARKYHPDTTTDPAEKARLTVIMAQINAAYRARNMDELYALDGQGARRPTVEPAIKPMATQRKATYSDLLMQSHKLDEEILWVKSEHQRLMTSPLMSLKIEHSLARSQGRDLLREIAAKVRADLDGARAELEALRRRR
jgi:hypothetical protein